MNHWGNKITTGVILVAIIATAILPAATLLAPQKAEAQSSCIAGIISKYISKLIFGALSALKIPVNDSQTGSNTGNTAGNTFGSWVSECIIKPMVKALVKQLIHEFLASIRDWINNGFDSSGPRFVSDIEGFFADVVDKGVGRMIYGSDLKFLCSPFALDIRLALGLHYWGGGKFRDRIRCTLSDVIGNVTSAGDRLAYRNSWQSWLDITTKPQNNPYGAFALAKSELEIRIANQKFVAGKEQDWGSGFLTTKRCIEYDTEEALYGDDPRYEEAGIDPCVKYETVTPGRLISEGIASSIGAEVDEYVAAEDIDAIFGALMNQMIGSIFSAAGIFSGTTRYSNYYRDKFEKDRAAGVFNIGSGATAPAGFTGFACETIGKYVANADNTNVDYIKDTGTVNVTASGDGMPWPAKDIASSLPPSTTPTSQYQIFARLIKYCEQKGFWYDADLAAGSIIPTSGSNQSDGENTQINIALGGAGTDTAIASQSSTLNGFGPQFGNDGSTFGGANATNFGIAVTELGGTQSWQVDFSKTKFSKYIETIVVTPASYINKSGDDIENAWVLLSSAEVTVYNGATEVYSGTLSPPFTGASPRRIPLCETGPTTCVQGTRVVITKDGGVALAEVSVFSHPQPIITSNGPSTLTIPVGTDFNEMAGITAKDFKGEDATVNVADIDTNIPDTYTLIYTATDSAGVPSNPLTRTITVSGGGGSVVPQSSPPNPPGIGDLPPLQ